MVLVFAQFSCQMVVQNQNAAPKQVFGHMAKDCQYSLKKQSWHTTCVVTYVSIYSKREANLTKVYPQSAWSSMSSCGFLTWNMLRYIKSNMYFLSFQQYSFVEEFVSEASECFYIY